MAARLNDLARPKGIVIDGNYMADVIPENLRPRFKTQEVYVRSIAERAPMNVFYSKSDVSIPDYALYPIADDAWKLVSFAHTVAEVRKMRSQMHRLRLPSGPVSPDKLVVDLVWQDLKVPTVEKTVAITDLDCQKDARGYVVGFPLQDVLHIIKSSRLPGPTPLEFRVQYVPKLAPTPKKSKKEQPKKLAPKPGQKA